MTNRRKRFWSYGSNTVITSVLFLGILAFIALIAERHPLRMDLTESGKFSLSQQTRNILKSLEKPIHIRAFCATASTEQAQAQDLLETYRYETKLIDFEFIDVGGQDGNFVVSGMDISTGGYAGVHALLADGVPLSGAASIRMEQLAPVVSKAAARWTAAGLTPSQAATLSQVQ